MYFLDFGFSLFWSFSLIGSTFNSVAGTCCTTVHTKFRGIFATLCPRDLSYEVQQVKLRATCRGDEIYPRLVLHNYKSINSHEDTCRCNISLEHIPATILCVCQCCYFVPATCSRYTSLLHVASVCTTRVFLSLQHVAALCPCNMTPCVCPPEL